MSHTKDAIAAAARCDTLTRRSRVAAHNEALEKLVESNSTVLLDYNNGPCGDVEKDNQVLGQAVLVITKGIYLAKREHEARVEQIRNHDDILRGLAPKLYSSNHDDRLSAELHEYIHRIQDERKRCSVNPTKPNDYTAVPCTPKLDMPWGPRQWFHRGVVFYREGLEECAVSDAMSLNFMWSSWAVKHDEETLSMAVSDVPFQWDGEMLAELEEAAARG